MNKKKQKQKNKGGYNSECWNSRYYDYIYTEESFIFSLSNPENRPVKFECVFPRFSIFDDSSFGPCFGKGKDIFISNNSNICENSYSNLEITYEG